MKREKEQLKSQQATLTAELQKMRNEDAVLRDKIRNDKVCTLSATDKTNCNTCLLDVLELSTVAIDCKERSVLNIRDNSL